MQRTVIGLIVTFPMMALLFAGCGGSDAKSSAAPSTGGSANSTGGQTSTPVDAGSGVGCGSKLCTTPAGVTGAPCCKDAFASTCGVIVRGACSDPPPPAAPGCPSIITPMVTLGGCCTATNQCGIDESSLFPNATCTELGAAKKQFESYVDAAALTGFPAPQPCP